jgi:hypothetical protein
MPLGNARLCQKIWDAVSTVEEARSQALKSARELWADAIKSGRSLGADAVVIAHEHGGLTFVPMLKHYPSGPDNLLQR